MRRKTVLIFIQILFLFQAVIYVAHATPTPYLPQTVTPETGKDSTKKESNANQKVILDSLKANTDIQVPIHYKSADSIVFDLTGKTLYLFKTGELKYDEMELKADSIAVNWEDNTLYAKGLVDSSGNISGHPVMVEKGKDYSAKDIAYNFKTQRGKVKYARTTQDGLYIIADDLKKDGEKTYYIKDGKFTTCDHEDPHYYIKSKKLKVIPGDKIISGPLMLVIEDFPLPVVVPFGFFPNQSGKKSGILFPVYGESSDRGFFLRNGGYYFAINDYVDFLVRGDIFSKGGYRLEVGSSYKKRYRYDGTFSVEYGVQKFGEKTDSSRSVTQNFFVRWAHDQKINPHTSFKATVNAGSSNFLSNNSYNEQDYLTNTLKSNITLNKSFANSPWNMTLNLDHSQNTKTKQVQLGLPNLVISRPRFFPFKKRSGVSKNSWYEKIGLNYTMNFKNEVKAPDSLLFDILLRPQNTVELITPTTLADTTTFDTTYALGRDYFRNGIQHRIPISTNLSLFQYINLTPSINFNEFWYFKTVEKFYSNGEVQEVSVPGFATARSFDAGVSASTRFYGVYQFKGERKTHVRHTALPTVGFTYQPDFADSLWGYYKDVQTNEDGDTERYSRFSNGVFGGPQAGERQSINFGINNVIEMKRLIREKDKKDNDEVSNKEGADSTANAKPKDPWVRSKLIDNFGITSNYNFAADSLNLAAFRLNLRTSFLNNKINFQGNATLDPYKVNIDGRRYNEFVWTSGARVGRLTSLSFTAGGSLRSKKRVGNKAPESAIPEDELDHIYYYRDLYVDFTVPWTLNLNYNFRYTNTGLTRDTVQTLNFTGDVNLTPKWKVGFTSGYDFSNKDFSYTSISIYRDLHCWEMSVNWIPFGNRKSYNFSLNVKSATLKDLKLTRRRDWQDRFR